MSMDRNNPYQENDNSTNENWNNPQSGNDMQYYAPYRTRQTPPRKEKKKGVAGVVIACTLSAALIGGTVGGLGGIALGRSLTPTDDYDQTIAQLQKSVADLSDQLTSVQTASIGTAAVQPVSSGGMSVADIAAKVSPSVVAINASTMQQQRSFFGQVYESEVTGSGSGVIISEDGYIVTNNHVAGDATKITVILQDGTEHEAKLIGRDSQTDIAVLKIDASDLPAAEIGSSADLRVGDTAIAIGNPLGELAGSVTQGIVSATEREITIEGVTMNLLQIDAAVNEGNSGGALVNDRGQLVGIVNAKTSAVGVEGIGFAIPIDDVQAVIDDIVDVGYVTGRPKVGISTRDVTQEVSEAYNMPMGAYIGEIEKNSAADLAGLQVGDIIISFDGEEITQGSQITKIRDQHEAGDVVEVIAVRQGEELTFELTLMEDTSQR